MKIASRTIWTMLFALLIILVVLLIGILPVAKMHYIKTTSMTPTMPKGTLVLDAEPTQLAVGDVVTFTGHDIPNTSLAMTTHRIVSISKAGVISTKGDANPTADVHLTPLTAKDVVGKVVFHIPAKVVGGVLALLLLLGILMDRLIKGKEEGVPVTTKEEILEPVTN